MPASFRNFKTAASRVSFCFTASSSLGSRVSTPRRRLTSSGATRTSAVAETEMVGCGGVGLSCASARTAIAEKRIHRARMCRFMSFLRKKGCAIERILALPTAPGPSLVPADCCAEAGMLYWTGETGPPVFQRTLCMQAAAAESEKLKSDLVIRSWERLLIGLDAGLIIWGAVQVAHPVFRVSKKFDVPSIGMPTEMFLRHRWEQDRVDRWNAALYLGGLGLLVSLAIGAWEGVARRSIWPLVSAPLGALGGVAGGMLCCMVLQQVRANGGQADLMHTIEAQLAVGVPLGLAVGLSAGLMTWT